MYSEINKLLALSKKGDIEAKEKLLFKLKPLILASIRRYYNKSKEYDDLIQEGYGLILEGIEEYNPDKNVYFLGYIKLKLKYHYLNKHKEKQLYSLNEPIGDGELEVLDLIEGDDISPLDNVIGKEEKIILINELNSLSKREKQIIIEFYINYLSLGEIADKLGISYRTVANTKSNGINKLKKRMVK